MKRWIGFLFAALLAAVLSGEARADEQLTVVELFTSQGCNSCPPADSALGELAKRDGVIALGQHITYWDYLGWKDIFGSEAATDRQRSYGRAFGRNSVYTPQMVIGGAEHVVGSNVGAVEQAIRRDQADRGAHLEIVLEAGEGGDVVAHIPASSEIEGPADIWLFRYDSSREVDIARGENAGRTLRYHNVVREIRHLGLWAGEAQTLPLGLSDLREGGRDGCAVIVQGIGHGPIIGAARMALDDSS